MDIRYIGIYQPGNYFVNVDENDTLLVRNDANVAANVVNEIRQGSVVNIKEFENGWGKVTYGETEGWANLSFLTLCDEDYADSVSAQTMPAVTSAPIVDSASATQSVTTNTSSDYNYEAPAQQEQPASEPEQSIDEPSDTPASDELQWNDDELTWN